jgi:hypothetical protein
MAVRAFDLTDHQAPPFKGLEAAPVRRREVRRSKQRYALIGIAALTVPFVAALVALGVAH